MRNLTRIFLTLFFAAVPGLAQCSLCRLAVEQDASLGSAFNKAIVLMMVPALAIFAGVFVLVARSRPNPRRGADEDRH
jgi:hypothetical protein